MNKKILFICQAAMVAALYVVLTIVCGSFASGPIQVRLSEALTILPYFFPAAIPGVSIGCLLANLLTGCAMLDVIFGTIATLLGALGTYFLRRYSWLAPLPPIIFNTIIIPWVLRFAYGIDDGILYLMLTIGIGEILSCYGLGFLLLLGLQNTTALQKRK